MSVDDTKRLLDNGAMIVIFRNDLGSYTAAAFRGEARRKALRGCRVTGDCDITDDFEPSKALCRLAEKQLGNIVGIEPESDE